MNSNVTGRVRKLRLDLTTEDWTFNGMRKMRPCENMGSDGMTKNGFGLGGTSVRKPMDWNPASRPITRRPPLTNNARWHESKDAIGFQGDRCLQNCRKVEREKRNH